ncbi:MAG: alanine--glyoxylate aminotransferase family protein [Candidatus Eremiobacteraeota bacterium]|nr:alanine--glyoxylate aminotransferase family protein [Candidatus Eremiobacteraeota bacterium]
MAPPVSKTQSLLFIPGPVNVPPPTLEAMTRPLIDHRGPEFKRMLERTSSRLRPLFGTRHDIMFLGASGTGGLEAAVWNLFGRGEKILACPVGVFGNRLVTIAKAIGCDVEIFETKWGRGVDHTALGERLRADTEFEIKGIFLTHNETSTGVQNEMHALSTAIGKHPALVVVDSVSGLGGSTFLMDDWGFDVVVAATQKVLAAPPGVSMVAVSDRAWEKMEKNHAPRFYFDLRRAREFAKIGQTPWTPPVSVMFALERALDLYERDGEKKVHQRLALYAHAIRNAAVAIGLRVFSTPPYHSNTVVAIHCPERVDASSVLQTTRDQGYVLSGGQQQLKGKIFRIGTMGDITRDNILSMLASFEDGLERQSYPVDLGAGVGAAREVFKHGLHAMAL